jgi:hypothetical protein
VTRATGSWMLKGRLQEIPGNCQAITGEGHKLGEL